MRNGEIHWDEMRAAAIVEDDLLSALRRKGQIQHIGSVRLAILERNGEISVIARRR